MSNRRDPLLLEALKRRPGTSELTIETGSESHSTSWGSAKITTFDGAFLPKDAIFERTWNDKCCLTTFPLPIGSRYLVTSKGVSGPRGAYQDNIEMIIEITAMSRKDYQLPAGPGSRRLEGRFKVIWANRLAQITLGCRRPSVCGHAKSA